MPDPAVLQQIIALEPTDAIAWLQKKYPRKSWQYHDMLDEAHARAFTVARSTRMSILKDLQSGLLDNLKAGGSVDDYIKALQPTLEKRGWWGKKEVIDPLTGEIEQVQLGSVRRLTTIYQTNMQSAYMAGREKAMVEASPSHPYWQYIAIDDGRTRATHRAMHLKTYRQDDPIWQTCYPPNGYNCRCRVRPLSEADLKREGLTVSSSAGQLQTVTADLGDNKQTLQPVTAERTGINVTGPDGKEVFFAPDAGFNSNPGVSWGKWSPEYDWQDDFTPPSQVKVIEGQKIWQDYDLPDIRRLDPVLRRPAPAMLPAAPDLESALDQVASATGVSKDKPFRFVDTPVDKVVIRYDDLEHVVEKREHERERYADYLLPTLQDPLEVWLTQYNDGQMRQRFVGAYSGGKKDMLIIVQVEQDGSIFWNLIPMEARSLNAQREGALLWSKSPHKNKAAEGIGGLVWWL